MTRLGPIPAYLTAPVPRRQSGRVKSQGRVCPSCKRVFIPTREGKWPWHHHNPEVHRSEREFCGKSDQGVKGWRA